MKYISISHGNRMLEWVEAEPRIWLRKNKLEGLLKKYQGFCPHYLAHVQAGLIEL